MRLTLSDLVHAPLHSYKYQGHTKYLTKNCNDCRWYVEIAQDNIRCYGGKYWQGLVEREAGPRKCELFGKEHRPDRLRNIEELMTNFVQDLRLRIERGEINTSSHKVAYMNRVFDWDCRHNRWELRWELIERYARFIPLQDDQLRHFFTDEIMEDIRKICLLSG